LGRSTKISFCQQFVEGIFLDYIRHNRHSGQNIPVPNKMLHAYHGKVCIIHVATNIMFIAFTLYLLLCTFLTLSTIGGYKHVLESLHMLPRKREIN
jgi:hypothetical protein